MKIKVTALLLFALLPVGQAVAQGIPSPEPAPVVQPTTTVTLSTTTFLGHRIGETLAEFNTIEHSNVALEHEKCNKKFVGLLGTHGHGLNKTTCETQKVEPHKTIDTGGLERKLDATFTFDANAQLKSIKVVPDLYRSRRYYDIGNDWDDVFNLQVALLKQRYGAPTIAKTATYQNAMGARWECPDLMWTFADDGTQVTAVEMMVQTSRLFTIVFERPTKASDLPKVNNPY